LPLGTGALVEDERILYTSGAAAAGVYLCLKAMLGYPFERHGVVRYSMVPQFFYLLRLGGIFPAAYLSGMIL